MVKQLGPHENIGSNEAMFESCLKLEGLNIMYAFLNYNSIFRCMLCIKKWMYMEVKSRP